MATTTQCFTPILGKRIRVTELDECGAILPTARKIVTDGFVTISLSAQIEEGTEILVRNAAGNICVNEKAADSFKRFDVELEFCDVNPSLLAMTTNAVEYEAAADKIAGFTVPEGEITGRFALELWTGLAGQGCGDGGEVASGYLVLPQVQSGTLGDIEVTGEDAITFSLSNAYTRGGNTWGVGPYDVILDEGDPEADPAVPPAPAPLPEALDPFDHLLMLLVDVAPPPVACSPSLVTVAP